MLRSKLKRRRSTTRKLMARRFTKVEYTIREAAELRGVHPLTVRRKIRSGAIVARLEVDQQLRSVIYKNPHRRIREDQSRTGQEN